MSAGNILKMRAGIERRDAETFLQHLPMDDPGNQIAGNDEEDIDAGETARHDLRERMIDKHRHHGDRAQAVDVGAISDGMRRART